MSIINNALSGSLAAQIALDTTSQNVANVMTPGYTRQGVLMASVFFNNGNRINPGDGVSVPSLIRFSDSYKSQQMWRAASNLGQYSIAQPYLTQLEQVMGDDETNINAGLDIFFGALNAASVDPASMPLRNQVISAAGSLAQRFNNLNQLLSTQTRSVQDQRSAVVDQINELIPDIATLNQKIASAVATGVTPSGLIDERDLKIDKLASQVGVQVIDQPDGSRSVALRDGQPLVVGSMASKMAVDAAQNLTLTFGLQTFTLSTGNLGGQLGGLYDFENNKLGVLKQSLSDMASKLADMVNGQLVQGVDLNGATPAFTTPPPPAPPPPPYYNGPLFVYNSAISNAMLSIYPGSTGTGLTGDEMAFAKSGAPAGDSTNLQALIALKDQTVLITGLGSNVLLGDVYTQLVGKLGTTSEQNQTSMKTSQTVRDQAEESWKSTSGVNNDEEAANLIQYQHMYQANMKVIAVANQLFDATLAMFG